MPAHILLTRHDRGCEIISPFHLLLDLCARLLKQQIVAVTGPSRSGHQRCRHECRPRKQTLASVWVLCLCGIDVGHTDMVWGSQGTQ